MCCITILQLQLREIISGHSFQNTMFLQVLGDNGFSKLPVYFPLFVLPSTYPVSVTFSTFSFLISQRNFLSLSFFVDSISIKSSLFTWSVIRIRRRDTYVLFKSFHLCKECPEFTIWYFNISVTFSVFCYRIQFFYCIFSLIMFFFLVSFHSVSPRVLVDVWPFMWRNKKIIDH